MIKCQIKEVSVKRESFCKTWSFWKTFSPSSYTNCTIKFYILSRYRSVATTLTKVVLFQQGLPGILSRKYLSFFIVKYLSSSKAQVSNFATWSWHSQKASQIK